MVHGVGRKSNERGMTSDDVSSHVKEVVNGTEVTSERTAVVCSSEYASMHPSDSRLFSSA